MEFLFGSESHWVNRSFRTKARKQTAPARHRQPAALLPQPDCSDNRILAGDFHVETGADLSGDNFWHPQLSRAVARAPPRTPQEWGSATSAARQTCPQRAEPARRGAAHWWPALPCCS